MSTKLQGLRVDEIRHMARQDAQDILSQHWTPYMLPVEPVTIARSLGLSVFSAQLGDDVFGMLVGGSGGADIYLDRDQPRKRFRFSCAHEIGHYLLRADDLTPDSAFIDKRSDDTRGVADEIYANDFAGSLLMPEPELLAEIRAGRDIYALARIFDVSLDALRYRRQLLAA
ncbi:MAG: ImmA/IrrE family metallo-endopeptidase [Frankiaceae bacterium]